MEKKTKLALFDMDQTLLDSDFAWAEAFILIAKEIGFENADDFGRLYYEANFDFLLKSIMERDPSWDVKRIFDFLTIHIEDVYKHDVQLKKNAVKLVDTLKKEGYITAILTANNPHLSAIAKERFLKVLGVDAWHCCQEWGVSKGDSSIYDFLSDMYGIDRNNFVLFDDAEYAVETAYRSGIRVIRVYNPREMKDEIGNQPYPVIVNLDEFELSMLD
ncbi:MAG: HAD family phosphatase [Spirochaetales bacterium]|nr:HAD family phosphatase [Spirochaetales bacterium]